jgi:hypothetical protein
MLFMVIRLIMLLIIFATACFFGVRELVVCAKDMMAYHHGDEKILKRTKGVIFPVIKEDSLKSQSFRHRIVVTVCDSQRIAIVGLPVNNQSLYLRRTEGQDGAVAEALGEPISSYQAITDLRLYFVEHCIVGLFLIFFGLVFLVVARVTWARN